MDLKHPLTGLPIAVDDERAPEWLAAGWLPADSHETPDAPSMPDTSDAPVFDPVETPAKPARTRKEN